MADVVYDDGPLKITTGSLRIFSKSYPIGRIERIGLRRDPLFMALPFCAAAIGFCLAFFDYLYTGERLALIAIPAGILWAAAQVGVLYIQVGGHYSPAAIIPMKRLQKFYNAAINVLPDH